MATKYADLTPDDLTQEQIDEFAEMAAQRGWEVLDDPVEARLDAWAKLTLLELRDGIEADRHAEPEAGVAEVERLKASLDHHCQRLDAMLNRFS